MNTVHCTALWGNAGLFVSNGLVENVIFVMFHFNNYMLCWLMVYSVHVVAFTTLLRHLIDNTAYT